MQVVSDSCLPVAESTAIRGPAEARPVGPFWSLVWFGLLCGWAEMGINLIRVMSAGRLSMATLRTNRHFLWMVPLSDALIFAAVGLALVPIGRVFPRLGRWVSIRLPITLCILALLWNVEGLYPIAGLALACGFSAMLGPWLERRSEPFGRLVRWTVPAQLVVLAVLTGLATAHVVSAERRALALCPPARPDSPNVLLIVLDDVRAASLSLLGHDRPTTPNLQRLAQRGVVFTEARSTAPWTLPSHASVLTGRWPHELSVGADRPLDTTFPTLAETLGKAGYTTAGFVGNTCYCNARFGIDRGFARYEDHYENQTVSIFETIRSTRLGLRLLHQLGYPVMAEDGGDSIRKTAEMINRDVLDWLAWQPAGRPFFVFLNYYDAHSPFLPPEGSGPLFGMAALPLAQRLEIDQRFLNLKAGIPAPPGFDADQIVNAAMQLYLDSYESCIAYLDRQVGLLLDAIERRGALDNTLVIVTSDHGEQFGEHGLQGHGLSLYRREVHVPLLLVPPASSRTVRTVEEPVSIRAIPSTVADWAGLSGSLNPFPARSLRRFLTPETQPPHARPSTVLCEVEHMTKFGKLSHVPSTLGPVRSLVSPSHAYIRDHEGREELYDLVYDPLETDNFAASTEARTRIKRFREQMKRFPQTNGMANGY